MAAPRASNEPSRVKRRRPQCLVAPPKPSLPPASPQLRGGVGGDAVREASERQATTVRAQGSGGLQLEFLSTTAATTVRVITACLTASPHDP